MKWFAKSHWRAGACAAVALFTLAGAARAELERYAQRAEASSPIERALFKVFALPTGPVVARRPAAESRAELAKLIEQTPSQADLYSIRALEAEKQLDFAGAEADWKKYAELSANKLDGQVALANYYARRVQPKEEVNALAAAASLPSPASEKLTPPTQQTSWKLFERIVDSVNNQDLDPQIADSQFRAWATRYPEARDPYGKAVRFFAGRGDLPRAENFLTAFQKAFPQDIAEAMTLRGQIETARGTPDAAVTAFDQAFRPDWPEDAAKSFMTLVEASGKGRAFRDAARARLTSNPEDTNALARLFHYHLARGDAAPYVVPMLNAFLTGKDERKSQWTEGDLLLLAWMFESTQQYDQAAKCYHSLYLKGGPSAGMGLASIARLLLEVPDQRLAIGAGDLSLYRDVAKADPYPGYLNGVLSLLFNETSPWSEMSNQNERARSYFHRARASEVLDMLDQRYPDARERSELRAKLIEVYATYGEANAVVREGSRFLSEFPKAPERTRVSISMADAYARLKQEPEELAVYKRLLEELSAAYGGEPVGVMATSTRGARGVNVRSPDYVRILDRYIGRLTSSRRVTEALAVYRGEIERNANDPGIYERFAAFLEQNKLGAEIEDVYKKASARFADKSWSHKLARWYLRQKRTSDFEALTRDVVRTFEGTELESYFQQVTRDELSQAMYRQLNQYARDRFPHNLAFVRNVLATYANTDPAYERILREHWFHAEDLRSRFFELLSRTRRLDAELQGLQTLNPTAESNAVALQMLAEGEAWRTRFESAAPHFNKLSQVGVSEPGVSIRAAALHRSLDDTRTSIAIEENLDKADPLDTAARTRIGEIYADHESFADAKAVWDRIPELQPGNPDRYLEVATLYWDYFQFDDALRHIQSARDRKRDPTLFAYEEGAIHENKRQYAQAITAYVKGAIAGNEASRGRLLQLGTRATTRQVVELAIRRAAGPKPTAAAAHLLISLYEMQKRRPELETQLLGWAATADTPELMAEIVASANTNGMPQVSRRVAERAVELASDPVEKTRLRLELAKLIESQGDAAGAGRAVDEIYNANPANLGVIRTAVNLHWRSASKTRALEILEASADKSVNPELKHAFMLEAARKATEAADYTRARRLADALLAVDPIRSDYLAARAGILAAQKDDAGLREFYRGAIESVSNSNLSAPEKVSNIASIRRDLIPVLKRSGDATGAVDQYIEIVNRYPEDAALLREAGRYAAESRLEQRLLDYYAKTAAASAKDFRWPMVLAGLQMQFGDASGAADNLRKATAIRPDRVDLLTRLEQAEERLLRFDDAVKSCSKLYELTYKDPAWTTRAALNELRAGRPADAVATLRKGYLEDRPDTHANYRAVASQLLEWGQINPAKEVAAKGLSIRGDGSGPRQLAELAGVIAVRLHENLTPPANLNADLTNGWWEGAATAVGVYGTPAEKVALAGIVERSTGFSDSQRINMARSAGLADVQARLLATDPKYIGELVRLQNRRGRFDELGGQLEVWARDTTQEDGVRPRMLSAAAEAYRRSGNAAAELRALTQLGEQANGSERYAQLVARQPQTANRLLIANKEGSLRGNLLNEMMKSARPADLLAAIRAATPAKQPVWGNAFAALAGLHYGDTSPGIRTAFEAVLGPATIGERLAAKPDANRQLVGGEWFDYAGRYGELLQLSKDPNAIDYVVAPVEGTGANSRQYLDLAALYADWGEYDRAVVEYGQAVQLRPSDGSIHSQLASVLSLQGKQSEALAEWRAAIELYRTGLSDPTRPISSHNLATLIDATFQGKAYAILEPEITPLVQSYASRNGGFEMLGLLESGYRATGNAEKATAWIVTVAGSGTQSAEVLRQVAQAQWLPDTQKLAIFVALVESLQRVESQSLGDAKMGVRSTLAQARIEQAQLALRLKQPQVASRALNAIDAELRNGEYFSQVRLLELKIAAQNGTMDQLAAQFRRQPDSAPDLSTMLTAALELRQEGSATPADQLLEFAYQREIENGATNASNFIGLAGIQLGRKDTPGALKLLRRMTIYADDAASGMQMAADTLESNGLKTEGREFLEMALKIEPWNAPVRIRLGQSAAVAADGSVAYRDRTRAAREVATAKGAALQTGVYEIDQLSAARPWMPAADAQRYLVDYPQAASDGMKPDPKLRTLQIALANAPDEQGLRVRTAVAAADARRDSLAFGLLDAANGPEYLEETGSLEDRRTALRTLSMAGERLGDPRLAARFEHAAGKLAATAANRLASERRVESLERAAYLKSLNEERMPVFGSEVAQSRMVRPRLKVLPRNILSVPSVVGGAQ